MVKTLVEGLSSCSRVIPVPAELRATLIPDYCGSAGGVVGNLAVLAAFGFDKHADDVRDGALAIGLLVDDARGVVENVSNVL